MVAIYLPLLNSIGHIVPAVLQRQYNPGLISSIVLFIPLGAGSLLQPPHPAKTIARSLPSTRPLWSASPTGSLDANAASTRPRSTPSTRLSPLRSAGLDTGAGPSTPSSPTRAPSRSLVPVSPPSQSRTLPSPSTRLVTSRYALAVFCASVVGVDHCATPWALKR
ncbi:MAG: HXXEE domain-containing protein [Phycisphaerales bacterium]|nr:HXXEE domain-containing protein [Phycisphaerales bacterium]